MYEDFYQLSSLPFENTSDPRFFFASEQHREALAAVEYAIRMRKGVVMLTGEIGSGKTTVGRMMCENCGDQATILHLTPRHNTGLDLIRQVLQSVGLPVENENRYASMLHQIRTYLLEQLTQQRPVALFVDEAQSLADDALEELRMLTNLDTHNQKLIQAVLIGQPELRQRIRQPQFDALRQRIVMAKQLHPFQEQETADYINHRLAVASRDPHNAQPSFTHEAIQEIHRTTGGIARLINIACDNCLLLGSVQETRQITPTIVHRVVQDMVPRFDECPQTNDETQNNLSLAGNL